MLLTYGRWLSMFATFFGVAFAPRTAVGPLGINQWMSILGVAGVILFTGLEVMKYVKARSA